MKEKVLQILQRECPGVNFFDSTTLVDDGVLDSLLLVSIVMALTAEFGVVIPYTEIIEENFNSVDALVIMIERLMDEQNAAR